MLVFFLFFLSAWLEQGIVGAIHLILLSLDPLQGVRGRVFPGVGELALLRCFLDFLCQVAKGLVGARAERPDCVRFPVHRRSAVCVESERSNLILGAARVRLVAQVIGKINLVALEVV